MMNLSYKRAAIILLGVLGCVLSPAAASARLVETSINVGQRVDAFNFSHAYEDYSLEGAGISGYEPTGRSELWWTNMKSTFTEVSVEFALPSGDRLRLRGGRGDFQTGKAEDLDYGSSGNLWSHTLSDASAGGITNGSVTYALYGGAGPYWGISGTRWNLRLDGGQDLLPGNRNEALAENASTYDAQQVEAIIGTGFVRPLGNGRIRLQGEAVAGTGWIHSEARWGLRDLAFTHDGYSLSAESRLGMSVVLGAASRIVLDATAGGTYVPYATGTEKWKNGQFQKGGGIEIKAGHWALGTRLEVGF